VELNSGYGDGYGYGEGYGDGSGYGYGEGYGDGYSSGYGYGSGYGDGYSSGYGYGSGSQTVRLSYAHAWKAWHYIQPAKSGYTLRNGNSTAVGDKLHEDDIAMCSRGLHASLTVADAKLYAPNGAVLTEVKVWGDVILGMDKLVATDREIV